MAYLAIRGSGAVNGVSRVHGGVSRKIFQDLFPRWPLAEVPVGHVTNGVHMPTWASAESVALWNEGFASRPNDITPVSLSGSIAPDILAGISDCRLWDLRCKQRAKLIAYTRKRFAAQRATIGATESAGNVDGILNPDVLTFAFARRFAEYKRPALLLHDPDRFARILTDPARPAQLILSGKAHPADGWGQGAVKQWHDFIQKYELHNRVVFLADYDMGLTQNLVRGADLWLNTPRQPWEASGTSGMKVLVNGGLNCSELDGWWAEAYAPEVGWGIGDPALMGSDDVRDAEQLYAILEGEVKTAFYDRDAAGVPKTWAAKMRASMTRLTPMFSAHRTVSEYIEHYYKPATAGFQRRAADGARLGSEIAAWCRKIEQSWPSVAIISRQATSRKGDTPEVSRELIAEVHLGALTPNDVVVEAFADNSGAAPFGQQMEADPAACTCSTTYVYRTEVPAARPDSDYTVRVVPYHPNVQAPLEVNCILWEK